MYDFSKQLSRYMPEAATPIVSKWIVETRCQFRVAPSRRSKLGDYRTPYGDKPHRISVNHDLNAYSFLITTVHEFAHLLTFQQYRHKVAPHGKEWKQNFRLLMSPFFELNIFPTDIYNALKSYMENPMASSCTDLHLYRVLKAYDQQDRKLVTVEDLAEDTIFRIENGRVFQKKQKLRKRYKCIELESQRIYLFQPIAEVMPIKR